MPELIMQRVGTLFRHRDTRLTETLHPTVLKSIDLTDLGSRFRRHQIRLDYGLGGDDRLYVEIPVYRMQPRTPWTHLCIDVAGLFENGRRPHDLRQLAKLLRTSQIRLATVIIVQAPWRLADPHAIWN